MPTDQWVAWLGKLAASGFEISSYGPLAIELKRFDARPGEVVLFNGNFPDLTRIVSDTCTRNPHVHVVVANEVDASSVQFATRTGNEALHIFGPISPDHFVDALDKVFALDQEAVA
jgi:hypothetical protein